MNWRFLYIIIFCTLLSGTAYAQFIDEFDRSTVDEWRWFTGDGDATMDFKSSNGYASIDVDATQDKRNIWWALIQRTVSEDLDLTLLQQGVYELRIEARIRVSHAPRRVNLHAHTQKTTDFHTHLMEFDIPDTVNWHTISMTTEDFEAEPDDTINAQLALMDWGLEKYRVDIDYFKVDVIDLADAAPDKGEQVQYPPPELSPDMFTRQFSVSQNAMVDIEYPGVNFENWYAEETSGTTPVLTVGTTQYVLLRWNLRELRNHHVTGPGLLTLTTHSLKRAETDLHEFGKIRIVEILNGDPLWKRESVTVHTLTGGKTLDEVFNSQMVIDVDVSGPPGSITSITIPRPVLQRMVDGTTLGLAIRPLGTINVSFYAKEYTDENNRAVLYLNTIDTDEVNN